MEKKNKKIKKLDEGYSQILLEDIRSTMQLMAEQQSIANKRIEKIEIKVEKVDKIESDVAVIKSVLQSHSKDIKEIKSDISILKCDVFDLKSDVKTLKSDVSELKSDVKRIDQKLDTQIENNDKRFQKIEEKVFI